MPDLIRPQRLRESLTAATFRNSTSSLFTISPPGMMQAGIRNLPGAVIIGGGLVVDSVGSMVGAIGVSGARPSRGLFLLSLWPEALARALIGPPTARVERKGLWSVLPPLTPCSSQIALPVSPCYRFIRKNEKCPVLGAFSYFL
jgi:hypothetical protein